MLQYVASEIIPTAEDFERIASFAIEEEKNYLQALAVSWQHQAHAMGVNATFSKDPLSIMFSIIPQSDDIFGVVETSGGLTETSIELLFWKEWMSQFSHELKFSNYGTATVEQDVADPIRRRLEGLGEDPDDFIHEHGSYDANKDEADKHNEQWKAATGGFVSERGVAG